MLELEKLRTENLELQHVLKGSGKGSNNAGYGYENDEVPRLRSEINLLENLVQELRAELKNKRPVTPQQQYSAGGGSGPADWED